MQRSWIFTASACTILIASALPDPATANLIVNGSFEVPGACGQYGIEPGSTLMDGWVVKGGTIDYIGDLWSLDFDGACYVELDGVSTYGGVAQTFPTVAGQSYRVTFLMAGNPLSYTPTEPKLKLMRVAAAGESTDFSYLTDGHKPFESHEWLFSAISTETTLEFFSLATAEAGYVGAFGPRLDDVVVQAIPEPGSLSLLLVGMALLAGQRARG